MFSIDKIKFLMADHQEEYRNLHLEVTTDKDNIDKYIEIFEGAIKQYFSDIKKGEVYLKIEAGRPGPPPPPPPPNGD